MATTSMILNLPQAPGAPASPSAGTAAASKIGSVGVFRRLPLLGPVVRHAKVICLSTSGSGMSHSLANGLWPSAGFLERGMYGARGNRPVSTCGAGNTDSVGGTPPAGGSGSNYAATDTGAGGTLSTDNRGPGAPGTDNRGPGAPSTDNRGPGAPSTDNRGPGAGGAFTTGGPPYGNQSAPGTGSRLPYPGDNLEDSPFTIGTKGNGIGGTRFNSISEMRIHYFGADIPGGPPPRKPDPNSNPRNPSGRGGYSKGPGKTWPNPNYNANAAKAWSNPNAGRTWPNPSANPSSDAGSGMGSYANNPPSSSPNTWNRPSSPPPYQQNQGMAQNQGPAANTWSRPPSSQPPPYQQNPGMGNAPGSSQSPPYRSNDSWPASNAGPSTDQWNRPTSTPTYQQNPGVGSAPGSTPYRSNDSWPASNTGPSNDQWNRPTSTQNYQNPGMGSAPGSSSSPSTGWPASNAGGSDQGNPSSYPAPGANTDYGWKKGQQTWPNPGEGASGGSSYGGDAANRGS